MTSSKVLYIEENMVVLKGWYLYSFINKRYVPIIITITDIKKKVLKFVV